MGISQYLNEAFYSTDVNLTTIIMRLFISFVFGAIIGFERQIRRREAGLRTFTLICLGSTLAMLVSIWIPQTYPNFLNGDPGRIAAQVLAGIGFLGAGAIIQGKGSVYGLTTAACIWVVAIIGIAVGAGMYVASAILTILTVSILVTLEYLEKRMMLTGVNKILTIVCSISDPDIKKIEAVIKSFNIYIASSSYEYDYSSNTSILTYKVNLKARSSYPELFSTIRETGNVSQIKILV